MCDRVAVIYEGKIVAIVDAKETNEQQLGLLMAGGTGKGEHKWLKSFNRANN